MPGQGFGRLHDLFQSALGHNLPAVYAGARADINDMIGLAHGILIVLHHDYSIAQIAQAAQGCQEAVVIPRVQPDAGFIQDI